MAKRIPRSATLLLAALLLTGLLPAGPAGATAEVLEQKDFEIGKDGREEVLFPVGGPGTLLIRIHVRKPLATAPVKVLLTGPDGIQVEKQGSAPLRLRYEVSGQERIGTWRAEVRNPGKLADLSGELRISFEETAPEETGAPAVKPDQREVTDGKVLTPEDQDKIRAACRDKNRDVFVRVDMERETGGFFMSYHQVFELTPRWQSDHVILLHRGPDASLYLDTENKLIFFGEGAEGTFCRVRIFHGDG